MASDKALFHYNVMNIDISVTSRAKCKNCKLGAFH